ncbi:MAG: hypothetical protein HY010_13140 [Acidobacteria bacterium]|nr:hypothetical protein [Acidobacteriota bacterium]
MKITDPDTPDPLPKFTAEMEKAIKDLRETALRTVVPASDQLSLLAKECALPTKQLQGIFEKTEFLPSAQLKALAEEMRSQTVQWSQTAEEMRPLFEHAAEVWRECRDGAARLAKSGWTLPAHMTPREMLELLNEPNDDAIDRAFIEFYHDAGQISFLKRAILASPRFKEWEQLLEQCFDNYESGKYLICIPALLSVLEGGLALPEGATFIGSKERIKYFNSKLDASQPLSIKHAMWNSMNEFVKALYQDRHFDQGRPLKLNRHWILHGRDIPSSWRQADALRLFHALSTICSLCSPVSG